MSLLDLAKPNTALAYAPPSVDGLRALATTPVSPTPTDTFQGQYQVAKANADYANSFGGLVKNTITDLGNKAIDIAKTGINAFTAPIQATGQAGAEVGTALKEGNVPKTIAEDINLGRNVAFSALAPVSAAFAVAEKIPALKPATDILNFYAGTLPSIVGKFAGSRVADFTDKLPMTQENKVAVRNALEETGSAVGQIWLGGKVIETLGAKGEVKPEDIIALKEEAKSIPENSSIIPEKPQGLTTLAETPAPKVYPKVNNLPEIKPITIKPETKIFELKTQIDNLSSVLDESPAKQLSKYANKNGELPEVLGGVSKQTGKGAKSKFGTSGDSIVTELGFKDSEQARNAYQQYIKSRQQLNELKTQLKTTKAETFTDYSPEQLNKINTLLDQTHTGIGVLHPAESTGKVLPSRLASNLEVNAVERKLTKSLGDLPEYNQVSMKEQAQHANDLILNDPDKAMRVAMGEELPPHHILPEAVFTAVENKAIKEGNVEILKKLATESNLSTQATAMGQRIRALGERDQESPVGIIRDVQKARETNSTPKAKQTTVNEIKAEIKKHVSSRISWEDFVKEVQCNY